MAQSTDDDDQLDELEQNLRSFSIGMPTLNRDVRRPGDYSITVDTPEQARVVLAAKLGETDVEWIQRHDPDFAPLHPLPPADPMMHWTDLISLINDRHTIDQRTPVVRFTRPVIQPLDAAWYKLRCESNESMPHLLQCTDQAPRQFRFHRPIGISAHGIAVGLANQLNKSVGRWLVYRDVFDTGAGDSWRVFPLQLRSMPSLYDVYNRTVALYDDAQGKEHCVIVRDVLQPPTSDNVLFVRLPFDEMVIQRITISDSYLVLIFEEGVFGVFDFASPTGGEWFLCQPQRDLSAAAAPATPAATVSNPCNPDVLLETPVAPYISPYEATFHAVHAVFDDLDPYRLAVAARDGVVLYGSLPPPGAPLETKQRAVAQFEQVAMNEEPSLDDQKRHPPREPAKAMNLRGVSLVCGGRHVSYRSLDMLQAPPSDLPLPRYPCYAAQGTHAFVWSAVCCGTLLALFLSSGDVQLCSLAPSALNRGGSWLVHSLKMPAELPAVSVMYRAFCSTMARLYVLLTDGSVVFVHASGQRAAVDHTDTPASAAKPQ